MKSCPLSIVKKNTTNKHLHIIFPCVSNRSTSKDTQRKPYISGSWQRLSKMGIIETNYRDNHITMLQQETTNEREKKGSHNWVLLLRGRSCWSWSWSCKRWQQPTLLLGMLYIRSKLLPGIGNIKSQIIQSISNPGKPFGHLVNGYQSLTKALLQ